MKRQKLLLADNSVVFCEALAQLLQSEYEMRVCRDGMEALSVLEEFRPDVLVADLMLPGMDGISLLKAAASRPCRPALLATSCYESPFIRQMIKQIGVDYMMLKPCDIRSLAERIRELSQGEDDRSSLSVHRDPVAMLLMALSVPSGRRGYRCLETVISLYRADSGRSLTKDLYPTAGRLHGSNGAAVERAIRSVIETAWENRDESVWRLYFSATRGGVIPKPTNRGFIAAVATALGLQEQKQA